MASDTSNVDEGPTQKPEWCIWGTTYTPPAAALFSLNFLDRNWFGAKVPAAEAMMLVRLLINVYAVQKQGLLMSKKDVMAAIGAEHISTVTRYTKLAEDLGFIDTGRARLGDNRLQLLHLTAAGQRAVEKELEMITQSARWLLAETSDDPGERVEALKLKEYITVEPPKLESLALVADELIELPVPSPERPEESISHKGRRSRNEPQFRPLTARRWVAAYSETLRFDPDNREALQERAETSARLIGDYKTALDDLDRLVQLDPAAYLARRATLQQDLGKDDEAIADIDRLCELRPNEDFQYYRITRAKAFARKGEWDRAHADLEYVFSNPLSKEEQSWPEEWLLLRGMVLANVGHLKDAIPNLRKAREWLERYVSMYQKELERSEPLFSIPRQEVQGFVDYYQNRIELVEGLIRDIEREIRRSQKRSAARKLSPSKKQR